MRLNRKEPMTSANADTSAKPSGRLVAISNRTAAGSESKAGGLAVALWETLVENRTDGKHNVVCSARHPILDPPDYSE